MSEFNEKKNTTIDVWPTLPPFELCLKMYIIFKAC